jgi:hypothetical protein
MLNTTYISECFSSFVPSLNVTMPSIDTVYYSQNAKYYGNQASNFISTSYTSLMNSNGVLNAVSGFWGAYATANHYINQTTCTAHLQTLKDNWVEVAAGLCGALYFADSVKSILQFHAGFNFLKTRWLPGDPESIFTPANLATTGVAIGLQFPAMAACAISAFSPNQSLPAINSIITCTVAVVAKYLAERSLKNEHMDKTPNYRRDIEYAFNEIEEKVGSKFVSYLKKEFDKNDARYVRV